ncbi:MAG TPA: hypothetical protein VE465_27975, partial [Streptosporangiaceae bacterium]|nr:hypothetical protein [Streptosporangiaceae bacterium]
SSLEAQITAMPPGAERTDRRGAAGRYTANGRPDGVAEAGDRSHLDDLVLSVRGAGPLACDWEWVGDDIDALRAVIPWTSHANELRALTGEPDGHILTRLWTVRECLSKIGRTRNGPLTIDGVYEEGWVLLRAGSEQVVSTVIDIGGDPAPGELGDTAARAAAIAVLIKIGGSMTATPPPRDES